jgi:hypothetical protein
LKHFCVSGDSEDSSQPEGLVWKQLKRIVGRDAPPSIMLVDLKDSIATKFLPPVIQEFRYDKKDCSVFDVNLRISDYESLGRYSSLSKFHSFHESVVPNPFINVRITFYKTGNIFHNVK